MEWQRRRRFVWTTVLASVAGLVCAFLLAALFHDPWRSRARWLFESEEYKAEVLAQRTGSEAELQHVEWEGWGWAGQNTVVYLVLDPKNALAQAAHAERPGKYPGIPCEVASVRRLASQWYAVQFYTNSDWRHCF